MNAQKRVEISWFVSVNAVAKDPSGCLGSVGSISRNFLIFCNSSADFGIRGSIFCNFRKSTGLLLSRHSPTRMFTSTHQVPR